MWVLPFILIVSQYCCCLVTKLCPTLVNPWAVAPQASLSFTISQSLFRLRSIESLMPSNHLILSPFSSCPQSFPVSESFRMSQLFAWSSQSTGSLVSASVFPMNMHGWFPLGLTGLISWLSQGLSRVFSNTTVQKHQFFGAQCNLIHNVTVLLCHAFLLTTFHFY